MSAGGLFLLLALSIILTMLGRKTLRLLMPEGIRVTVLAGWVGGIVGSMVDLFTSQLGPELLKVYWGLAFLGSALFILALGLAPFFKILFRKS